MGKINDYLDKHGMMIAICLIIFILVSMMLITVNNGYELVERERELLAERTYFEGTVTEVIFDDNTIIIEFDNQTIVRLGIGRSYYDKPIPIDLWQEYQFTVDGYNNLVDYRIIEGDE
ncbi:hypothetical protein KAU43_03750 [candidate division WOR-3 bacterium]|nr:hypothetical protein [candidate division WOR-3 bacterium]